MSRTKKHKCAHDPGIERLAVDLKLISDPNRLRMICLLAKGEKRVSEVVEGLGISQQLASHHLNTLREKGMLTVRREGTSCYYSVDQTRLKQINLIFEEYLDYRKIKPDVPTSAANEKQPWKGNGND